MSPTKKRVEMKDSAPTKRAKRITLQNLIKNEDEIWVRNRSGEVTGKEAGNVVMQVGSGNMIDVVLIPPGKDPICLTDQVTPKLLADCLDLFKQVKSGVLEVLDPADAEKYYEQNQDRQKIVEDKIDSFVHRKKMGKKDTPTEAKSANIHVHPKVGEVCLRARHANVSEREAIERLMEQAAVLTADDYNYVIANGVFDGVKRWARDQLSNME